MATAQSPFIRKSVKCPSCHHPYGQRYFRKNMFVAVSEEADHHVSEYRWLAEKVPPVHPPHYFVCFCPKCFYADTIEDYSDPWRTDFGPYGVKYFRRLAHSGDAVVQSLGARVDFEAIDFQSAMNLHYLAVYTQLLPPEDLQDAYKIARLYLRVAWLYRENSPGAPAKKTPSPQPVAAEDSAGTLLVALDRFEDRLREAAEDFEAVLPAMEACLAESAGQGGGTTTNPFLLPRKQLEVLWRGLGETAAAVRRLAEQHRLAAPAAPRIEPEPPSLAPLDAGQYRGWLEALRAHWPSIPLSEAEATGEAIRWFTRAIEKDSRLSSHEQFSAIGTLIAQLHLRLGAHELALDMVNGIYQSAVETRMKYMEKIREDASLSGADRKKLEARMNRVVSGLEDLVDQRDELIRQLFERDKARIQQVLGESRGQSVKAREALLVQQGIRNEVIARLKRKGGPLAPPN